MWWWCATQNAFVFMINFLGALAGMVVLAAITIETWRIFRWWAYSRAYNRRYDTNSHRRGTPVNWEAVRAGVEAEDFVDDEKTK